MDIDKIIRKLDVIKNERNKKLIEEYLIYIGVKSVNPLSKTTVATYCSSLINFCKWWDDNIGDVYLFDLDIQDRMSILVDDWRIWCKENGNSKQTLQNKMVALSSLFTWGVRRCKIKTHSFAGKLEPLRIKVHDKVRKSYFLTHTQIIVVRTIMERETKKWDIQDRLMWELFLDSGCRINAIQNLTWEQLDLDRGRFLNVREKNGYIVEAIFFDEAKKLIKQLIDERERNGIDCPYVFVTKHKGTYRQMAKESFRTRIKKMGIIIGIENLYPHTLRKSCINLLSRMSGTELAKDYANHKDVKITRNHYIQKTQIQDIRDEVILARKNIIL